MSAPPVDGFRSGGTRVDVVEHGPASADLSRRRARAARSIRWLGVAAGGLLAGVSLLVGFAGDLYGLIAGLATAALFVAAGFSTERWLGSLERRAVTRLEASETGLAVHLADGRTLAVGWTDPNFGLSARMSPLFPLARFTVIRLPGVSGLLPGFLVNLSEWDRLVEMARRAGALVSSSNAEGRREIERVGSRG